MNIISDYVFVYSALLKVIYWATFETTKKWTSTIRYLGQVYGELSIMYEGQPPEQDVEI